MLLMIDNYDSFTYNLVQYLGELSADVRVHRNDAVSLSDIETMDPEKIVISPGPCTPNEAGISMDVIKHFASTKPILGVCLGHEAMAQVYGGKVIHAQQVMHGKVSAMHHHGEGVFKQLPNPLPATRYHSLVVDKASLPDCFEITAWSENAKGDFEEIMAIRHKTYPMEGVQFHPESIMTEQGHQLLKNFLQSQ